MKRSTATSLAFAASAAAALWAILAAGQRIQAPPHLAGVYDVYWEWGIIPPREHKLPPGIQIEQSGLFITVTANDQILSRGQLRRTGVNAEGRPTYAYERDSMGWPLDIHDVSAKRLTVALGNRKGHATRDKTAPRPARPAPGTSPSTRASTRPAS